MEIQAIALVINALSPLQREKLGETLLVELTPTKIAELLTGLAKLGQHSSFSHTAETQFIGDIIADATRRLVKAGLFCEESARLSLSKANSS